MKDDCGSKIVKILSRLKKPIDANELVKRIGVNKTTVYRQIDKMVSSGKIISVELGDGKKRYELSSLTHHHHVICKKCGKLEDIMLNEDFLIKEVIKRTNFKIETHNLEFFGFCESCTKKIENIKIK